MENASDALSQQSHPRKKAFAAVGDKQPCVLGDHGKETLGGAVSPLRCLAVFPLLLAAEYNGKGYITWKLEDWNAISNFSANTVWP